MSIIYKAASILKLEKAKRRRIPKVEAGKIIIEVGDWSIQNFCAKGIVAFQEWYKKEAWYSVKLIPGLYGVRIPISGSYNRSPDEHMQLLAPNEQAISLCLAATTIAIRLKLEGLDPLSNNWCRCLESFSSQRHVALTVNNGRIMIDDHCWGGGKNPRLCFGASEYIGP